MIDNKDKDVDKHIKQKIVVMLNKTKEMTYGDKQFFAKLTTYFIINNKLSTKQIVCLCGIEQKADKKIAADKLAKTRVGNIQEILKGD